MTYDFNIPAKNLFETPIYRANGDGSNSDTPYLLSHALADFIQSMPTGKQALKFWGWAEKLYKDGSLELDESDVELLKHFITENPNIPTVYAGQLLRILLK